ncbi:MAG TPA: hypothetical protein VEB43_16790 [Anaeromyxobacter sp.]|nr:hypothetical protein [Anaeromyxobacter sp.]
MTPRRTARELEGAAARRSPPTRPSASRAAALPEPLAMLVRRGLRPRPIAPDLPFPPDLDEARAVELADRLSHYAFRLFLRGAILAGGPFRPGDATRYLSAPQAARMAAELVRLGLAAPAGAGRFRLVHPAANFGGTLEWWVGRELGRRLHAEVVTGVRSGASGVGGDLDVVLALEGKLVYVELKSSPPKHVSREELRAFVARVRALRPHLAVLAIDTALRLRDKVLPDLVRVLPGAAPARLQRENYRLLPHVYAVNARQDLIENVCLALADGLRGMGPGV